MSDFYLDKVFLDTRESVSAEDILPLTEDVYQVHKKSDMAFWDFLEVLKKHNLNADNFIILKNKIINDAYYNPSPGVYVEAMLLPEYFDFFQFEKRTKAIEDDVINALKKGNYDALASYVPEPLRVIEIERLLDSLPDNEKYKAWKAFYIRIDAGFRCFNQEKIKDVLMMKQRANKFQEDNCIQIYRGQVEGSTPLSKCLSWTLSEDVAIRFANRGKNGKVYVAKCNYRNVIDYIDDRSEKEILVFPEDVEIVDKYEI